MSTDFSTTPPCALLSKAMRAFSSNQNHERKSVPCSTYFLTPICQDLTPDPYFRSFSPTCRKAFIALQESAIIAERSADDRLIALLLLLQPVWTAIARRQMRNEVFMLGSSSFTDLSSQTQPVPVSPAVRKARRRHEHLIPDRI